MRATSNTFPVYVDAHGEHWQPADRTEYGSDWLRCVETDRGARYRPSVDREFGPLAVEQPEGSDR